MTSLGGEHRSSSSSPTADAKLAVADGFVYFTRTWIEPFQPKDFEGSGVSVLRWCKTP